MRNAILWATLGALIAGLAAGPPAACASAPQAGAATAPALVTNLRAGSPGETPLGTPTALEAYVRADDGAFAWTLVGTKAMEAAPPRPAGVLHTVRLTSQRWTPQNAAGTADAAATSQPEWTHWLLVFVPEAPVSTRPILFIGGGRTRPTPPEKMSPELEALAASGAIVAVVTNVPNQPVKLAGDDAERSEDGLVARTWLRAMETGDPTWIARFPMVKAAVRAIDAAEALLKQHPPKAEAGAPAGAAWAPGPWLVAGGSKRGWTAWLTAAVEPRVGAVAPLVIDLLDIPRQMRHHLDAYGFWAPALNDYVETGIAPRLPAAGGELEPALAAVLAHDDPLHWLSRVGAKPKFLINAGGDEFFLPDSLRFYETALPQPWRVRYHPNAGHGLRGTTAVQDLVAFYRAWAADAALPAVAWRLDGGVLEVTTNAAPAAARHLTVATPKERDFRLDQTGKTWAAEPIEAADARGDRRTFRVKIEPPAAGFRADMVELTFAPPAPGAPPLVLTTRVFVTPDRLPHASK